jgi:UDP-glucose:(heptosyl)LPS alpha-1,3-glucosyltransferase
VTPLRIALVVHDYNRHIGHSRYVVEMATRFKRDHAVHVFANTFEATDGITPHRVPAWRKNALASILSFVPGATLMARGNFDIIHSQGLCGLRHDIATAHFCQPAWDEAVARRDGGLTRKQKVAAALVTPLERRALTGRGVRRVIAVSEKVRADLARFYGRTAGVTVVPLGVDTETFHPRNRAEFRDPVRAEMGIPGDACLALYVGDLKKGGAAAVRAAARVPGVRLALVSASDPAEVAAVARDAGVADRVVVRPRTREVHRYFAAADVFLFPTVYETFGLVICEAMASGLPVVTCRTAGAADRIRHGETGWLADDPSDADAIADGLRRLAADPGLRERVGAAARGVAVGMTWDRVAEETMAVYREVVAEKRGGR